MSSIMRDIYIKNEPQAPLWVPTEKRPLWKIRNGVYQIVKRYEIDDVEVVEIVKIDESPISNIIIIFPPLITKTHGSLTPLGRELEEIRVFSDIHDS